MITAFERRNEIAEYLSLKRHATAEELAEMFGVSARTIFRDLEILTASVPIELQKGRSGGIRVDEHWYLGKRYLTGAQEDLLRSLLPGLQPEDAETMQVILQTYARPATKRSETHGIER